MSLIQRHSVERKFVDGDERDVLVVVPVQPLGAERVKALLDEASALRLQLGCYRIEMTLPATRQSGPFPLSEGPRP